MRRWVWVVVAGVLAVPATAHASGVQGPEHGREVVLLANAEGGTVQIVDSRTYTVLREINVLPDGPTGEDPARQAVIEAAGGLNYAQDQDLAPDGRTLYVSRGHRGDVAAFDVASGKLVWKVKIPGFRSDHTTLSDDGRRLYVSALTENVVVVVDTARRAITGQLAAGQWPHDNHLSPDGTRLYNASIGTIVAPEEARAGMSPPPYQLTVASTDGLRTLRTFAFERGVRPIVISHDEKRMFAQLSELHGLIEFDLEAGRIVRQLDLPVDPGVTEDDYDFEAPHHGLAISPDEKTLCAAGRASDYVALVSAESFTPLAIIEVDDAPGWAATGPDGRACFVPNTRADTLSVISYAERREVARVKVGDGPKQIEAARIPQDAVCVKADVPGCTRAVRLRVRCDGRRVRVALVGALDEVYGVRFHARGRTLGRRSGPPFTVTRRVGTKRVRAVVRTAGEPILLARRVPRCR